MAVDAAEEERVSLSLACQGDAVIVQLEVSHHKRGQGRELPGACYDGEEAEEGSEEDEEEEMSSAYTSSSESEGEGEAITDLAEIRKIVDAMDDDDGDGEVRCARCGACKKSWAAPLFWFWLPPPPPGEWRRDYYSMGHGRLLPGYKALKQTSAASDGAWAATRRRRGATERRRTGRRLSCWAPRRCPPSTRWASRRATPSRRRARCRRCWRGWWWCAPRAGAGR